MARAEAQRPLNEFLADKWTEVAEGLAKTETELENVKRRPAA
jgi:hypothetical protein